MSVSRVVGWEDAGQQGIGWQRVSKLLDLKIGVTKYHQMGQ
jgi:hypothetical protein